MYTNEKHFINKTRIVFLCLLLLFSWTGYSQGFLGVDGKNIVDENGEPYILKGMGLGGWMLQEGYMLQTAGFANPQYQIRQKIQELIGEEDTDLFYEAWLANHVRKIDIDSLKAWGFNSVRLPMHYNLFTLPIQQEPVEGENTWLEKGFELTDSLIAWCRANEMYVILDLHAAPGGQGMDEGISDYNPDLPSLWESEFNQQKTVALWKRIAQRYADEPIIAGYDLINETNWNMPGNQPLRNLYNQLTDSIRVVDNNHIIFIEGNWFANDFTGLTPPWDDKIVYSPHKYWSFNDQASIQWVLDIREQYDVPLYFGETGENSNTWFRDAIKLFEEHNIGWAWWPMKKIESIAGPLSVIKTDDYNTLLDYWNNGGTTPSAAFAKAALMEITELLKLENCIYQKDVIDAMFRQINSTETVPFAANKIPGIIYATDFDMGPAGYAYDDITIANYQVSTGAFTAWNQGWSYRNDGVDIEVTEDNMNTNGYNVGWMETGEWIQYTIDVEETALYDIQFRIASNDVQSNFHLSVDGADVTPTVSVPNSNGWQNWQTLTVQNVLLTTDDQKLRFHVDDSGFNLNSMQFIAQGASTSIPTIFVSAITLDESTIQLNLNKPLAGPLPASPSNFLIFVDGTSIPISSVELDDENSRVITFTVDHEFRSQEQIRISYNGGDQISALDGTPLVNFSMQTVQNTIAIIHSIPGRVQAEDYFFQLGIQLETTNDEGGGQNIGFLDPGDYLDYFINVGQAGTYNVDYRTAALSESGQIRMELIDGTGNATALHTVTFPPTGDWQSWTNTSATLVLPAGMHQLRMVITQPLFNMNWFEFDLISSTDEPIGITDWKVFPNPTNERFQIQATLEEQQDVQLEIRNLLGQLLYQQPIQGIKELNESIDVSNFAKGIYFFTIQLENGRSKTEKLIKVN